MSQRVIELPSMHTGQRALYNRWTRRNVVRCGRRWGKTLMIATLAGNYSMKGKKVGIFTPNKKQWSEIFSLLENILHPLITRKDRTNGLIRLSTGGLIDFWSVDDNYLAGRGREYDEVLVDETAFTKNGQFKDIWQQAILPTMLTTKGRASMFSTPFGIDADNFFYEICIDKSLGWMEFHAPSISNPYVPPDELAEYERTNHPMVFRQEYLAEFVDWSGEAFFSIDKMLVDGLPVAMPTKVDGVYAVIDTAVKGGKEHDGTAVVYFAINKIYGHPLIILDWDVVQIDGAMLELWLPSVFQRLEDLAKITGARHGNVGAFIEDAAAGSILIQQGRNRNWPTHAIDSILTSLGKDERAISVSGYYHQGLIKIAEQAYNKNVSFKGQSKNHLLTQLGGYRIGDKNAAKRADDVADCVMYGIAIGVGNKKGV